MIPTPQKKKHGVGHYITLSHTLPGKVVSYIIGHTPVRLGLSGGNPGKIPERPGNALRAFPGIPLESTAGMPQTL